MKWMIWLIVGVVAGTAVFYDPGYVLIRYAGWLVELPLWLLIVLAVSFVLLMQSLVQLPTWIRNQPYLWQQAYRNWRLKRLAQQLERVNHSAELIKTAQNAKNLNRAWNKMPRRYRHQAEWMEVYAQNLLRLSLHREAEKFLRKSLKRNWVDQLVKYYGQVNCNLKQQIKQVEKWLTRQPKNAELLYVAAQLCWNAKLWGKAKLYVDQSIAFKPNEKAYQLLFTYLEQHGTEYQLQQAYQTAVKFWLKAKEDKPNEGWERASFSSNALTSSTQ